MTKNQNGQAVIETAFASALLATTLAVFVGACYLSFSSYWIKHNLYESLICYEAIHKINSCQDQARERIKKVISLNQNERVRILVKSQWISANLVLDLNIPLIGNSEQKISFKEKLGV